MSDHILVEREPGLLTLRMNRLDKKNALTRQMYAQMAKELNAANADPSVRAVLLSGSESCFTSGNDLMDFMQPPKEGLGDEVLQFMQALFEFSKPVIAAVAGPAVGIGTTMLLHCDFVYASCDALFKMPFVQLGLCPEYGSSLILPRLIGHAKASELLLLSESFSAEQAVAWGIANECLADGAATFAMARETALRVLDLAPSAVEVSKRLMRAPGREQLRQVIKEEGELFAARLSHPEAQEAVGAFVQKRKPDFSKLV